MRRTALALSCVVSFVVGRTMTSAAQTAAAPPGPIASGVTAPAMAAGALVGTWFTLTPSRLGGPPTPFYNRVKVFTDHAWYLLQTVPGTGQIIVHHGGQYSLSGQQYTETVEFANPSTAYLVGHTSTSTISFDGEALHFAGPAVEEEWIRATGDRAAAIGPEPAIERAPPLDFPPGFDGPLLARACEPNDAGHALSAQLAPPRGPGMGTGRTVPPSPDVRLLGRIEANPQDAAAYLDLARCYHSQNHVEAAQRVIGRTIEIVRQARQVAPQRPDTPRPIKQSGATPPYPASAQRLGVSGIVFVEATIGADGSVRQARVVGSVPDADEWALAAVRQWKFTPVRIGGHATESTTILRLKFSASPQIVPVDLVDVARFSYVQGDLATAEDALLQASTLIRQDISAAREWATCSSHAIRLGPTQGLVEPVKIHDAQPVYPKGAQAARMGGLVVMEAVIDERGDISCGRILRSVSPDLDAAALAAVRQWKYQPGRLNGQAAAVVMTITTNFTIQ